MSDAKRARSELPIVLRREYTVDADALRRVEGVGVLLDEALHYEVLRGRRLMCL